jgi:hypothetical protein
VGGIRCARCGSDNAAGSRYCGVCGVRLGTVPPTEPRAGARAEPDWAPQVTAARVRTTRETPDVRAAEGATSPAPAATDGDDRPWTPAPAPGDAGDDVDHARVSLDGSLQLPARTGARAVAIALILVVDAALVIAGVFLWRGARGADPAVGDGGVAALAADGGGGVAVTAPDAGRASGAPPPVLVPPPSGGPRPPSRPGPAGGAGSTVPADARSLDDLLGRRDAGPEPAPAAIDAGVPLADAAPAAPEPPVDAAGPLDPYQTEPADAATEPVEEEPGAGAVDATDAVARLTSRNQQRFQRCYRQAAKAYTPEQPLEGEVDIALRVMPTGEVRDVSAVRNTTGSESLAQCLVAVIAGWRVAAGGAEPIDMVRPFRFGSSP